MSFYNKNGIILCILSLLCEFIPCRLKSSAYDPLHKFLPVVFMSNTLENNLLDPGTVVPWTSSTCSSCMKHYTRGGSSLVVWWVEFSAFTAMAEVQSLVGQLRSHKPNGMANFFFFFLIIEKLNQCYKSNLRFLFRTANYPQVVILHYPLFKLHNQWLPVFLIWGRREGSRSICVLWEILLPPRRHFNIVS